MWESRRFWARFPRDSWEAWEACLWLSMLSTGPPFPQLCFLQSVLEFGLRALRWGRWVRIFFLLTVFQPIAFSVHLQNMYVVRQTVQ